MLAALKFSGSWNRLPWYMNDSINEGCTSSNRFFMASLSRRTQGSSGSANRSANSWVPSVATMTTSGAVPAATRVRIFAKKSLQSAPWIGVIRTLMLGFLALKASSNPWLAAASWAVPLMAMVSASWPRPGMSSPVRRLHDKPVPTAAAAPAPSIARRERSGMQALLVEYLTRVMLDVVGIGSQ